MVDVRIENISKSYGRRQVPVLLPLNLKIAAGEKFFLLGPSGCGKTTLLRIIAGLLKPDSGRIFFNDTDVTDLPPEKRRSPMVFQNYALWPNMTVAENVAFALESLKLPRAERDARLREALDATRMTALADRRPGELSGGQQQRVALARCLAGAPGMILLDEPLSNLDGNLRDEMRRELLGICSRRGLTAIYVTHDRREALGMADRIALLRNGAVAALGEPEAMYRRPETRFAAEFMGEANFLSARMTADGRAETALGALTPDRTGNRLPPPGKKVTLCCRPERIRLGRAAEECENRFPLHITAARFEGERTVLETAEKIRCFDDSFSGIRAGETVAAGCGREDLIPVRDDDL